MDMHMMSPSSPPRGSTSSRNTTESSNNNSTENDNIIMSDPFLRSLEESPIPLSFDNDDDDSLSFNSLNGIDQVSKN